MAKTIEDLIVGKIEGGIRGIKFGTKTIDEANVAHFLNKLLEINDGLYMDYMLKYKAVRESREKVL